MRDFSWRHTLVVLALPVFTLVSCKSRVKTEESTPKPIQWAIRMADSEMKRFPEAWMVDSNKKPRWGYTQGLEALAFQQLWLATGDQKYYDYLISRFSFSFPFSRQWGVGSCNVTV